MGWLKKLLSKRKAKERFRMARIADPSVKYKDWVSGKWQKRQQKDLGNIMKAFGKRKKRR